jgi:hypothetical protein
MTTFVHLVLKESMAQCGAGKHNQWGGYMTFLSIKHGIVKYISILTVAICHMKLLDEHSPRECICWEVKGIVAKFTKL